MAQTSVDLDEEQSRLLRDLSIAEGRSIADVVREALNEYLARRKAPLERRAIGPRRQIPDDEWRSGFEAALRRIRAGIPPDMTPEEIEAEITAASEEVSQERLVPCQP